MLTLIKAGGSLLNDAARQKEIAAQIAGLVKSGERVVVVHGGGKKLTGLLGRLGVESRFHEGLRITCAETMDAALMALCGSVNKRLVADFIAAGVSAVGICGGDGATVRAKKFMHPTVDYGFVGTVTSVDTGLVNLLLGGGRLPVVACIALGGDGSYYNINADSMAAAMAGALKADRLVFLTDVGGVLDAGGAVMPSLDPAEIARLIDAKVISGGMLPKMRACVAAVRSGAGSVTVLGGAEPDGLKRLLMDGEHIGTEITGGAL
ncbi:MAG: acetylglutamate kinase [Myxococcota bacterium]|jgi:acetylglutamate kinase